MGTLINIVSAFHKKEKERIQKDCMSKCRQRLKEALDSGKFYEHMQRYRHVSITNQTGAAFAFEETKSFIMSAAFPSISPSEEKETSTTRSE